MPRPKSASVSGRCTSPEAACWRGSASGCARSKGSSNMVARFTICDSSKLELALTGELPDAALGELSRHLQSCAHCRGELEALAGGERWASDARQFLSSSDELVAVQEMTPPTGSPAFPP